MYPEHALKGETGMQVCELLVGLITKPKGHAVVQKGLKGGQSVIDLRGARGGPNVGNR